MRSVCLICALACAARGVETKPVRVLGVIDGETIEVAADLGGVTAPLHVKLLYVRCPPRDADPQGVDWSKSDLVGKQVTLEPRAEEFSADATGAIHAVVVLPEHWHNEEENHHVDLTTASLLSGAGVYWPDEPRLPVEAEDTLKGLEQMARDANAGAWATAPEWMRQTADERPAPQAEPHKP